MRICLAQILSQQGQLETNLAHHLLFLEKAIALQADFIVFPELSLTGYTPSMSEDLAIEIHDSRLEPIQTIADSANIAIGVGVPTREASGIGLSLLLFRKNHQVTRYSKQLLHEDETPYFCPGQEDLVFFQQGLNVSVGICYETMAREHFERSSRLGAQLYIASVAKDESSLQKAHAFYASSAAAFGAEVFMVNALGPSEGFKSAGQSAIWDSSGSLISSMGDTEEGLLLYDTVSRVCKSLTIRKNNT